MTMLRPEVHTKKVTAVITNCDSVVGGLFNSTVECKVGFQDFPMQCPQIIQYRRRGNGIAQKILAEPHAFLRRRKLGSIKNNAGIIPGFTESTDIILVKFAQILAKSPQHRLTDIGQQIVSESPLKPFAKATVIDSIGKHPLCGRSRFQIRNQFAQYLANLLTKDQGRKTGSTKCIVAKFRTFVNRSIGVTYQFIRVLIHPPPVGIRKRDIDHKAEANGRCVFQ